MKAALLCVLVLFAGACSDSADGGGKGSGGSGTQSPPIVLTTVLADALLNQGYLAALHAAGGSVPYDWSLVAGGLPTGMTLAASGELSGTPTQSGTFAFTVQVQDAVALTSTQGLSLTVLTAAPATPLITGIAPSSGLNDRAVPITITGSGFTGATLAQLSDPAGTLLTGLTVVGPGTINATIPAEVAAGVWTVTVTTPAGTSAPSTGYAALNMTDPDAPGAFAVGFLNATMPGAGGDTPNVRIYYPAATAGLNAPPSALGAPYPCVVYNHGFKPPVFAAGIDYTANTFLANPLAGLGYVVICVDMAPNNVLFGAGANAQDNSQRDADDCRAAISYLASLNANAGSTLFGLLDTNKVGVAGHSRGGDASLIAASDEFAALGASARIKAVAVMGPPSVDSQQSSAPISFGNFTATPALCIGATADAIAPYAQQLDIYALAGSPSLAFEIVGGNHSQYKDSDSQLIGDSAATIPLATQQAICRRYVVAWFNRHVKGLNASTSTYVAGGSVFTGDTRIQNRHNK